MSKRAVCREYINAHPITSRFIRIFYWPTWFFYTFFGTKLADLWPHAVTRRHLITLNPRSLSMRHYLQRLALRGFLSVPDKGYRYAFIPFSTAFAAVAHINKKRTCSGTVFIIGGLGPGGSERQVVLTLANLAKRNYGPIRLLCNGLQNEVDRFYLHDLESTGIPVSELESASARDIDSDCAVLMNIIRHLPVSIHDEVANYARVLHTHRPAVVHLWLDEVNIKAGIAAVALAIPRIILSLRSLPPYNFGFHKPYMREGYRWLVRQPGVILLNNSHAGARAYEKWLGIPSNTISVVHNGFDFDKKKLSEYQIAARQYRLQCNIAQNSPLIGTVMRFAEEKEPFLWLDIAALILRHIPTARFLMIGDGPLMNEMKMRAARNDLKDTVSFTGHIGEVLPYISAMDIFLLTSRVEGLPNVLIEAQALGVPVVTTNVGGAPEALKNGITGWVLQNNTDAEYAADILVKLLHDHAWLEQARCIAPEFIRNKFGIDRMIDETISIYEGGNNL